MDNRKTYLNKYIALKVNKQKVHQEIKTIGDLQQLEYASNKTLEDLIELNSGKVHKLIDVDYEYFYRAMCEFAIGLNKMDILKIDREKQKCFTDSFENIHNRFEDLKTINMIRDYSL